MSLSSVQKDVVTLTRQLAYQENVVSAFHHLTAQSEVAGLLETASISTKEHTKSLVVLSAALNVKCEKECVDITALNSNGMQSLSLLNQYLNSFLETTSVALESNRIRISLSHKTLHQQVDEYKKLTSLNVFDVLRGVLNFLKVNTHDDRSTFLVGTFSFDCYQLFEQLPDVSDEQEFPDYDFYLADRVMLVDHLQLSSRLVSKIFPGEKSNEIYHDYQSKITDDESRLKKLTELESISTEPLKLTCDDRELTSDASDTVSVDINESNYKDLVAKAKQHINAGDVFQIVLARQFSIQCPNPFLAYRYLRTLNPSPYMFYLSTGKYTLLGASPESAVKYEQDSRRMSIYPIAGTRARGKHNNGNIDHDLDARIELELKNDEKEKAEHLMLVDLARNDIARVCEHDSRIIERFMEIDRYSHVMHLVSKISGKLNLNLDAFSAYQASMNMGTLSGAPKVKATQLIRQYEGKYRGVYGGAMGYINAFGDMDTAIVIRSALVKEGSATVSAGAGIVYDSVPEFEVKETENKAASALTAIAMANRHIAINRSAKKAMGGRRNG